MNNLPIFRTTATEKIERLEAELRVEKRRNAELEDSLETERCRLAACGVVANANTRETTAAQRVMHEDYKSASLLDVIRAVDTEIKQRESIAELETYIDIALDNSKEQLIARIAELEKDVSFYRCCALSGEIPDDLCRPSSIVLQEKALKEQG